MSACAEPHCRPSTSSTPQRHRLPAPSRSGGARPRSPRGVSQPRPRSSLPPALTRFHKISASPARARSPGGRGLRAGEGRASGRTTAGRPASPSVGSPPARGTPWAFPLHGGGGGGDFAWRGSWGGWPAARVSGASVCIIAVREDAAECASSSSVLRADSAAAAKGSARPPPEGGRQGHGGNGRQPLRDAGPRAMQNTDLIRWKARHRPCLLQS